MSWVANDGEMGTVRLYAWLRLDDSGVEGIMTIVTDLGTLPLVVTDRDAALGMRPVVEALCAKERDRARLVVFERGIVIAQAGLDVGG